MNDGDDIVKIYSLDDPDMLELGQVIKTLKSKNIFVLLAKKELHAKEIGIILDEEQNLNTGKNPRLPNLNHHLKKMVEIGLLSSVTRVKNGHNLQYYKAKSEIIILVPEKYYEKAVNSKTLKTMFKTVFKFASIGIAGLVSWKLLPKTSNIMDNSESLKESIFDFGLLNPGDIVVPFFVVLGGLLIERFLVNKK